MFGSSFNGQKLKPQLKMAVGRIEILKNKKSALLKQSMRQVALLLAEDPPKEEKARIRGEALIRDDNLIEALEIIQLECELLHERIKLLEYSKECPPDLVSVVSTLIWAAHRVDVSELLLIKKQFKAKYGAKFEENALNNINGCLNERVVTKLSVQPPAAYLVQVYLEKICEQFDVDWKPLMRLSTEGLIEPMQAPTGVSVPIASGTGLGPKLVGNVDIPTVTGIPFDPNPSPAFSDITKTTTNNGKDEYGNNNNNNNNDFPTAPSFGPNGRGGNSGNGNGGGFGGGVSTTSSLSTTPRNVSQNTAVVNDYENEIVVPPDNDDQYQQQQQQYNNGGFDIPSAPPGSVGGSTRGGGSTTGPVVGGTVIGGPQQSKPNNSSYADLAARFNQLRK